MYTCMTKKKKILIACGTKICEHEKFINIKLNSGRRREKFKKRKKREWGGRSRGKIIGFITFNLIKILLINLLRRVANREQERSRNIFTQSTNGTKKGSSPAWFNWGRKKNRRKKKKIDFHEKNHCEWQAARECHNVQDSSHLRKIVAWLNGFFRWPQHQHAAYVTL